MLAEVFRHRAPLRIVAHEIGVVVHGYDLAERRAGVECGDERLSHRRERRRGERMKVCDASDLGSRPIAAEVERRFGRRLAAQDRPVSDLHDRDLRRRHRNARGAPSVDVRDITVAQADVSVHVEQSGRGHDPAGECDERAILRIVAHVG